LARARIDLKINAATVFGQPPDAIDGPIALAVEVGVQHPPWRARIDALDNCPQRQYLFACGRRGVFSPLILRSGLAGGQGREQYRQCEKKVLVHGKGFAMSHLNQL